MKRERKQYITLRLSFVFIVIVLLVQSCDLIPKEEEFKNPYAEKTQQIFNEISEAVFTSINENIQDKAYGIVTREEIMRYANAGYRTWAVKNGAVMEVFLAGAESVRQLEHFRKISSVHGMSSSISSAMYLDSLMTKLELTNKQIEYILELPNIVAESGNIGKLQRRINEFDDEVYRQLGGEEGKVVLQMSAIMQASVGLFITDNKLLAILTKLAEENENKQSYFYHPTLVIKGNNIFQLAQSQDDPSDPPNWRDYYNAYDMANATLGAAFTGAGFGGTTGAGVGSFFGPWGPPIGAVIGGFAGAIGGGFMGGSIEHGSQRSAYLTQLKLWCEKPANEFHEDFEAVCE